MDFNQALNTVIGELTPQPWEYTTAHGTTLTVIPEGLRAAPGDAEVQLCITTGKTAPAAEAGVATRHLPGLIAAIENGVNYEVPTLWREVDVRAGAAGGGLVLTVAGTPDASVGVPEEQRMPLASALRRALDVARGWED